jgi:hypothetical protein
MRALKSDFSEIIIMLRKYLKVQIFDTTVKQISDTLIQNNQHLVELETTIGNNWITA